MYAFHFPVVDIYAFRSDTDSLVRPMTPPSEASSPPFGSPEYITHRRDLSDVEYDDEPQQPQRIEPKKGGYDSRIEQILYENPELPILITDAGKSAEGGGKYIVYTIRTGVCALNSVPSRKTLRRSFRILKCAGGILSSRLCATRSSTFTQHLSSPRFRKSIPPPTMSLSQ